ncbi:hypothetical protein Pogu_1490 [Pyrobaculum oguniense TE7]|uniref:Pyrimidine dimer DNA glycosylase n=1 Tax=Pyrobaculum oguniense (strain DSM 13380 / JCM 10595 / TE7) TaxID=698757 RepID=H6QC45_PYROT|nr:hypothetical protein Pogu_1490 [Pyrobaculum oguniense TE7]
MQIFRPYVDHKRSAAFLDDLRLGKQRVEARQVIMAILRKAGVVQDGKRGWLSHPIVLTYYNSGRPYLADLVVYFYAVVEEWKRRGRRNNIDLADLIPLIKRVEGAPGTPITHVHEVEYRRVLLLKDPCHYYRKLSEEEVREIVETEPVPINGVNTWIFQVMYKYKEFVSKLRRGVVECTPVFPRRVA